MIALPRRSRAAAARTARAGAAVLTVGGIVVVQRARRPGEQDLVNWRRVDIEVDGRVEVCAQRASVAYRHPCWRRY